MLHRRGSPEIGGRPVPIRQRIRRAILDGVGPQELLDLGPGEWRLRSAPREALGAGRLESHRDNSTGYGGNSTEGMPLVLVEIVTYYQCHRGPKKTVDNTGGYPLSLFQGNYESQFRQECHFRQVEDERKSHISYSRMK